MEKKVNASIGNQWWRLRTKHGRDVLFDNADLLFEECCKYFEATDKRKWNRVDYKGKDIEKVLIPTDTPYTISGLCLYLGITEKTWRQWRNVREDLSSVINQVDNIIYTQKFEGATVGIYNANIIARDLGLMDKVDHTTQGEKLNVINLGSGVKPPDEDE